MNVKRIFGAVLTVLGIASLVTAAVLFNSSSNHEVKSLVTYSILGLIFFVSGISLVRDTKDEA
jgi:predicted Na+-dependent transporter